MLRQCVSVDNRDSQTMYCKSVTFKTLLEAELQLTM